MTREELLDPATKRVRAEVRPGVSVVFARLNQPSGPPQWKSLRSKKAISTRSLLTLPIVPQGRR